MDIEQAMAHAKGLLAAKEKALAPYFNEDGDVTDYYRFDETVGDFNADMAEALELLIAALEKP